MKNSKKIFQYMIPGIVGLLFNSLYIIVDGIFVSKMLGSNALAAVTLVVPIVELIIALSLMIAIGGGIYISFYKGKDDLKTSNAYFNTGFWLMLTAAFMITAVLLIFKNPIVLLLGATPDILELTQEYYLWFVLFIPFFMLNFALATWIRNDGKPNLAMMTQIIGAILNIVLDYVFMGPLAMGIKGAAIATGLGPVIGVLIILPHFVFKRGDLSFESVNVKLSKIKDIVFGGIPSFTIEFSLGVMTFLFNIFIAKTYAEVGLAAFGVIGYINLIVLSIFLGMGQGVQPLISELEGQDDHVEIKRIHKYLLQISLAIGIAAYILLVLFKGTVVSIFIESSEVAVYELAVLAINMFFISLPLTGVNVLTASMFEARNKVKESVLISVARSFVYLLPILIVLSVIGGEYIWYATVLAEVFTLVTIIMLWHRPQQLIKN